MTLLEKIDLSIRRGLLSYLLENFDSKNHDPGAGEFCFEGYCTNPEHTHYNIECVEDPKHIEGNKCYTCGFPIQQWQPIEKSEYANAHLDKKLPTLKSDDDEDDEEKKLGIHKTQVTQAGGNL